MERGYDYFFALERLGNKAVQCAEILIRLLEQFEPDQLKAKLQAVHGLEQGADKLRSQLMGSLYRDFLPPLEREDLAVLALRMNGVVHQAGAAVRCLYTYDIRHVPDAAPELALALFRCCRELQEALSLFRRFKREDGPGKPIAELRRLQEDAGRLLLLGRRRLYTTCRDPVRLSAGSALYDCLEQCCVSCREAAELMEVVMLKNR